MVQQVSLSNGMFALVDDEDFERIAVFRWNPVKGRNGAIYASRSVPIGKGRRSRQMQRDILDPDMTAPRHMLADHLNGNTLDCRRENLRWATYSVSNRNRSLFKNNTSGYRGVWLNKDGRYAVEIYADGKSHKAGSYTTAEAAAAVYNKLAIIHHGPDAKLNKLPGDE